MLSRKRKLAASPEKQANNQQRRSLRFLEKTSSLPHPKSQRIANSVGLYPFSKKQAVFLTRKAGELPTAQVSTLSRKNKRSSSTEKPANRQQRRSLPFLERTSSPPHPESRRIANSGGLYPFSKKQAVFLTRKAGELPTAKVSSLQTLDCAYTVVSMGHNDEAKMSCIACIFSLCYGQLKPANKE